MNVRRTFLMALGGVLAVPRFAFAQEAGRTYRLGWLSSATLRSELYAIAFEQRLPELAAELARQNCDVLLAPGGEATLAALERASKNTPIVAVAIDYDPVATGQIASLARPGGRITGVSQLQSELPAKPLGVELQVLEFKRAPDEYESAFAEAVRAKSEALLALASGLFAPARRQIAGLALKHRLPSMFTHSGWAEAGGLLSYGPDFSDFFRRAAEQVSKIMKGAKPAEMPVEQPTKFELVVNLKTAKALGLTIPKLILLRADKVIE